MFHSSCSCSSVQSSNMHFELDRYNADCVHEISGKNSSPYQCLLVTSAWQQTTNWKPRETTHRYTQCNSLQLSLVKNWGTSCFIELSSVVSFGSKQGALTSASVQRPASSVYPGGFLLISMSALEMLLQKHGFSEDSVNHAESQSAASIMQDMGKVLNESPSSTTTPPPRVWYSNLSGTGFAVEKKFIPCLWGPCFAISFIWIFSAENLGEGRDNKQLIDINK